MKKGIPRANDNSIEVRYKDKFLLRPTTQKDNEFQLYMRNHKIAKRYLSNPDVEISSDDQEKWYNEVYKNSPEQQRFILEKNGDLAGTLSLLYINLEDSYCEAGIIISPKFWGGNSASVGTNLLGEYIFGHMGLKTTFATTNKKNTSSLVKMLDAGFIRIPGDDFDQMEGLQAKNNENHYKIKSDWFDSWNNVQINTNFDPKNLNNFPKN